MLRLFKTDQEIRGNKSIKQLKYHCTSSRYLVKQRRTISTEEFFRLEETSEILAQMTYFGITYSQKHIPSDNSGLETRNYEF